MLSHRSRRRGTSCRAEQGRDRGWAETSGALARHQHYAGGLDLSIRPTLTDVGTMAPWPLVGRGCRSRWS
jgi:hypothetical protein